MEQGSVIPRWRSLGPISLLRCGPWEVLVPGIVAGAIIAAAWLASPRMRIAAVVDWRIAAVAGAALATMLSVRGFANIWFEARDAWPFVFASTVAGGVVFAVAARTVFAPRLVRASPCAPAVAFAESSIGMAVSYALPVAMAVVWMFYLLTRFPRIESRAQLDEGRDSRYRPYSRALRRFLPARLIIAAIVVAGTGNAVFLFHPSPDAAAAPEHILALLADPATALIDRARGDVLAGRLRALRAAEEQAALAHLGALELDAARPAVRRCACDWLLPIDKIDWRVADTEPAFQIIDREIDELSVAWKPSASTGAAVLRLLPLGLAKDGRPPLYPLLWRDAAPPLASARPIAAEETRVPYRGETVMVVRRSTVATTAGDALAEVAIKVLGRSGWDQTLPQTVSERLQAQPSSGPCPLAGGSYCATWDVGRLKLRLAPEDGRPVTPDTPLSLVLFDPGYFPAARAECCAPTASPAASQ